MPETPVERSPEAPTSEPVSVVLTVRDDAEGLRRVLAGLAAQVRPPDEVIVVDGGSEPGPLGQIHAAVARYPFVHLLAGQTCNIAEGRNRAIHAARHDIIACIDAGCEADPHWLARLTAPFADPAVEVVGGFYRLEATARLQTIVGLLTLPGQLEPVDPLRFNPSARSLAFRRRVWERAGGFPNWLYTAEDTLFDLKLRTLDPSPRYVFVEDAVVNWQPRQGWRAVFRQYRAYARGEARIGRRGAVQRAVTRRHVVALAWLLLGVLATLGGAWWPVLVGLAAGLWWLARPLHEQAARVRRKTGRGFDYVLALAVGEWLALAGWMGRRWGRQDRRLEPRLYVDKLRQYLGSESADVLIPPWALACPPPPRTLVVTWHWPPVNRASANVLAALFAPAPAGVFRVLTRRMPTLPAEDGLPCPGIAVERVSWPLQDDRPVRGWTLLANVTTVLRMLWRARRLDAAEPVQRVLTVHPSAYGLLAGWLIARRLSVPLIAYMHDLCSETLITRSRLRRWLWRRLDARILRAASLVIVPSPSFVEHYQRRGINRTWVLPHCLPADVWPAPAPAAGDKLRLIYAGHVYEAHADAVAALIDALHPADAVELAFLSRPQPLLREQPCRWLPRPQALEQIRQADAAVVALGFQSPYPDEIRCCFPSKIVDYVGLGKPVLAVVPAGCFVDRLVRETGCGVVVNTLDQAAIRAAVEELRSPEVLARCRAGALALAAQLDAAYWHHELLLRLSMSPWPVRASQPFPARHEAGALPSREPAVALLTGTTHTMPEPATGVTAH